MKRQGGFTLIELVVVIVILGILAVTAAPRFLNLQDDAREASLQGLRGALQGAAGIVYGRAAIDGVEGQALDAVSGANNLNVATVFGYPAAITGGITNAVDMSDWVVSGGANTAGASIQFTFAGDTPDWGCSITYTAPTVAGDTPDYSEPNCR
ncbi:MSHA pilin protein MshA [Vibrio ponticus]|nr:MSHA pilin protein MshA [Vibrio ponticus]